jgi:hypothetical protein
MTPIRDTPITLTLAHLGTLTEGMRATRRLILDTITRINAELGERRTTLSGESIDPLHEALAVLDGQVSLLTLIRDEQWPPNIWESLP